MSQQAQHRRVVDRGDRSKLAVTQRDDRSGAGVMAIGLVVAPSIEQPGSSRQRRGHVQHGLTGGDELLREQRTPPRRRLDGPRAWLGLPSERQQLIAMTMASLDT